MTEEEDTRLRSVALQTANSILVARQRAAKRSEFYLAEGQRLAHMGNWALSVSGRFDYWSPELFEICGLDPANAPPTLDEYLACVHPHDRESVAAAMNALLRDGSGCDLEQRVVHQSGDVRHIRWVGVPVVDAGAFKGFVGTALDVTEQELLTQELRRRGTYQAEAQRLSHTGSFGWCMPSGGILWSDETFRIFQQERTAQPSLELIFQRTHPDDLPRVREALGRASAEGTDVDIEHRLQMPDGAVKHVHIVARRVGDSSDAVEFVGAVTDITDAKGAEEALRQAHADLAHVSRVITMGEMAASIAHEVNQPLSGIMTNANAGLRWLGATPPDLDETRATLQRIIRDVKRASDVITRVRALSKKATTMKEPLDLSRVVHEVVSLAKGEADAAHVVLRTAFAADLPAVIGDRVQMQQVVLNLILNGIEAMTGVLDRPRDLTIVTRREGADRARVIVRDAGTGLDPEAADKIFDAFYTTKRGGMGMGLSISRSIIENHGGRLWAESNDGPGTTFQFTL